MFLNLSDWFSEISIRAIQGIIAGFIAGYVTVFLYKDFHFKSSLILPMILLSMAILGALFMMLQEGDYFNRFTDIVSLVASGYIYISYLDENKKISSQTED